MQNNKIKQGEALLILSFDNASGASFVMLGGLNKLMPIVPVRRGLAHRVNIIFSCRVSVLMVFT